MELKKHFQALENFYGEYLLQEGCIVVVPSTMDGGFLIAGNEVYPFGSPLAFEKALSLIKKRKNLFFPAVNDIYVSIIEKYFPHLQKHEAFFYTASKENFRGRKRHECVRLDLEAVPTIARFWGRGEEKYIQSRIERYPFYGIYQEKELIAWIGVHNLTPRIGIMGFLHVKEEHRGKGFAESLSAWLAEELFKGGREIGIHIWKDNTASNNLARKLGFVLRCTHSWFWHEDD